MVGVLALHGLPTRATAAPFAHPPLRWPAFSPAGAVQVFFLQSENRYHFNTSFGFVNIKTILIFKFFSKDVIARALFLQRVRQIAHHPAGSAESGQRYSFFARRLYRCFLYALGDMPTSLLNIRRKLE